MRKSDLINQISEKTGIPKVDVLVTIETMFKEVKESLAQGENIYIRGFGSFITKKRAAKIGRNIKRAKDWYRGYRNNTPCEIPWSQNDSERIFRKIGKTSK